MGNTKKTREERKAAHLYCDIVVAGGGASGMLAAIAAKTQLPDGEVLLVERNEILGRKLLATGNGRCNFTNLQATAEDYGAVASFVAPVIQQMPPDRLCKLFATFGIVSRREEEGRVYPYSGQGAAVCSQLQRRLQQLQVKLRCGVSVAQLEAEVMDGRKTEGKSGAFRLQLSDGSTVSCHCLILAVGGKAGGQYGCQGDGYRLLRPLMHKVNKPRPALVALQCRAIPQTGTEQWAAQWKGVRAQAAVSLWRFPAVEDKEMEGERAAYLMREEAFSENAQLVAEDCGEVQFTATGLSGICIFNLSRYVIYSGPLAAHGPKERYFVLMDFLPQYSREQAERLLIAQAEALREEPARILLLSVLHQRLIDGILLQARIAPDQPLKRIRREQIIQLAALLKRWRAEVDGTKGWNDAQVTAGGADCTQIDPRTMQSRLIPGLYLCGELLDVDGRCGGYNLQWAFSSGYVAGQSAGRGAQTTGQQIGTITDGTADKWPAGGPRKGENAQCFESMR